VGVGLNSPAPTASANTRHETNAAFTLYLPVSFAYATPSSLTARVVFHSDYQGSDEIYSMEADGSDLLRLTTTAGNVFDQTPAWGPGQQRIVFQTNRDGQNEIYVMNADGSNVQRLTNNSCDDRTPAWSSVTNKIAWASNCHGPDYDIWTMDPDGQNQVDISANSLSDSAPRWSPSTNQIVYVQSNTGIRIMNGDGSSSTPVTSPGNNPDWSPTGLQIAYQCINTQNGSREICVIGVAGGQATMLTNMPGSIEDNPVWGPSGQTLAFISDVDENPFFDIFTMPALPQAATTRIPSTAVIDLGSDEGGLDW
jgi:Tol biopolymer transport system component